MDADRIILHVDMDAFFAAIAVLDDPSLAGKAVLVGGDGPRSVVTTASYEARKFGCGSAMPMSVARRRCPHAVVVSVPGRRIREVSSAVFEVFESFCPVVQPLSVDEAFLDMTGSQRLLGPPEVMAAKLKQAVRERTGLVASVGVSFNKLLAKLASDLEKPDGLTVITPDNLDGVLCPLPIRKLWGIGPATAETLRKQGVATVGDLRALSEAMLRQKLGDLGGSLWKRCRGIDDRPVVTDGKAKSIGHEQTFGQDLGDAEQVRGFLLGQTEAVGRRLRRHGLRARGLTVKIRDGKFHTVTRSATFSPPTDRTDVIWEAARKLFDAWASAQFVPVRLIGVSTGMFSDGQEQLGLFDTADHDKRRRIDAAADAIVGRFGSSALHRGAAKPSGRKR